MKLETQAEQLFQQAQCFRMHKILSYQVLSLPDFTETIILAGSYLPSYSWLVSWIDR